MTTRRPKSHLRDRNDRVKVRRGWCRKNLHRLVGGNAYRPAGGRRRCRPCRAIEQRQVRARSSELGYRRIKCPVVGCAARVLRSSINPVPYVCRRHRIVLPEDHLLQQVTLCAPRVRLVPSLCICGQRKERPAKTCRACYMAFRKSGLWAAAQAAAALKAYWEQPA